MPLNDKERKQDKSLIQNLTKCITKCKKRTNCITEVAYEHCLEWLIYLNIKKTICVFQPSKIYQWNYLSSTWRKNCNGISHTVILFFAFWLLGLWIKTSPHRCLYQPNLYDLYILQRQYYSATSNLGFYLLCCLST